MSDSNRSLKSRKYMNKQLYNKNLTSLSRLKWALLPALASTLLLGACKKNILQLANPNAPTPQGSLVTEGGIDAFAQGIYYKWIAFETGDGNLNFFDIAWYIESNMGDEDFTPYSNFGSRYPMNIASITLPAPYGTVIRNPSGFATQLDILGLSTPGPRAMATLSNMSGTAFIMSMLRRIRSCRH